MAFGGNQTWVQISARIAVCPGQGAQGPWTCFLRDFRGSHVRCQDMSLYIRYCSQPLELPSLRAPWEWSVTAVCQLGLLFGIWIVQATNQPSVSPPTHPVSLSFLAHLAPLHHGFASASEPGWGQLCWALLPAQSSPISLDCKSDPCSHQAPTGSGGWSWLVAGGLGWAQQGAVLLQSGGVRSWHRWAWPALPTHSVPSSAWPACLTYLGFGRSVMRPGLQGWGSVFLTHSPGFSMGQADLPPSGLR